MKKKILVIGAGPGGYVAAIRGAQLGAAVTLVEKRDIGGTGFNRGCIPSKIMKTSAEILENIRYGSTFGIETHGSISLDLHVLMTRKETV